MAHRLLGKTGLSVSPIAFGAFKIGRNQKIKYAQRYDLPSDGDVDRLLNGALDMGINLIDTAPAYGTSEERIGRSIAHRRGEYILSTKVGETFEDGQSRYDFSRPGIIHSIHRSLLRLRTERLDFAFIHSDGQDLHILHDTDAVPTLQLLRSQGLIRFIGLSGKTPEGARAALPWADALMLEKVSGTFSAPEKKVSGTFSAFVAESAAAGVAILIKKPLASGAVAPELAIPQLLADPGVSTLIVGTLNLDHLRQNLTLAESCALA